MSLRQSYQANAAFLPLPISLWRLSSEGKERRVTCIGRKERKGKHDEWRSHLRQAAVSRTRAAPMRRRRVAIGQCPWSSGMHESANLDRQRPSIPSRQTKLIPVHASAAIRLVPRPLPVMHKLSFRHICPTNETPGAAFFHDGAASYPLLTSNLYHQPVHVHTATTDHTSISMVSFPRHLGRPRTDASAERCIAAVETGSHTFSSGPRTRRLLLRPQTPKHACFRTQAPC